MAGTSPVLISHLKYPGLLRQIRIIFVHASGYNLLSRSILMCGQRHACFLVSRQWDEPEDANRNATQAVAV